MHDRTAWERRGEGPRFLRGKNHPKLTEFTRACKTCGEPFSIFVTAKIADGLADSNNFALVNCELHRRGNKEAQELRSKDAVVSEELEGPYTIERELRAEVLRLLAENEALKNKTKKFPWEA